MRWLVVLAVAISLALAACGGGEDAREPSALPTASVSPSATPDAAIEQLAYVGADHGLWLVNADGSGLRKIADECGEISWSPEGDLIACTGLSMIVYDISGNRVWQANDAGGPFRAIWSVDGRRLAYGGQDGSLHIGDISDDSASTTEENAIALAWLASDKLLVGLDVQRPTEFSVEYDAYVIDVTTGSRERLPFFDDGRRLWMAPSGEFAAVAGGAEDSLMAVYSFATGEVRPLPGLTPGGASEAIPDHYVQVSWDGSYVYAANAVSQPTTIDRSDVRTGEMTHLGTVPAYLLAISGDGLVAWLAAGGVPETLTISDLDLGTRVEIGQCYGDMAWGPRP